MGDERADIWMPLYWGDYHKDTGHLNGTQHGFYMLLIGHYWTTGKPLPNDDRQLWRIVRADSIKHWKRERPIIEPFFTLDAAEGVWHHARIEREIDASLERKDKAKQRAEKAARTRWAVNKHAPSIPDECQSQSSSSGVVTTNPSVSNSAPAGASHTPKAQLITEAWEPSELDLTALRKERPDLVGALYAQRMLDFRDWCAANATRTFNPAATWRGFMRKTKTAEIAGETFDQRRIRLGMEALSR
jgi:uncharacterized protein YdaU (DUF1376 family)